MILFVDTSALVRRYDLTEPGSDQVLRLCRPANGHEITLLSITSVEVASALHRKLRDGAIDPAQRTRMWRLFVEHCRRQYRFLTLDQPMYRRAQRLVGRHTLRAYDALQLAAALEFARSLPRVTEFRFCTADRPQARAAEGEGLLVEIIS
ncbi:MAG: type II toxin-antitoxin system VapC family toxin [Dehalococcoidia bacterium]